MPKGPIDVLLFTALISERHGDGTWTVTPTTDVEFEVSLDDGATFQPAHRSGIPYVPDFFRLPPKLGPVAYMVRAKPTTAERWPVACRFQHSADKTEFSRGMKVQGDDASFEPSAWPMPVLTSLEDSSILAAFGFSGATLLHHTAHLSRVRDISDQALALINQGAAIDAPDGWLSSWDQGTPSSAYLGRNPLVDGHHLALEDKAVPYFGKEVAILEIADAPVPVVAVSWSKGVLHGGPTPFLIYVHPDLWQNRDYYGGQPYPGARYLNGIAYRNLYHQGDPLLTANGLKGLTTQVAASRKAAVIVVPIHRYPGHLGVLKDATVMEQVLREIQAFFCHRADIATPPQLGRVALSSFSNGAGIHLKAFLETNRGHPFLTNLVREIYLMDPRVSDEELTNAVISWSHTGPKEDKRARVYLGVRHTEFLRIIGASAFGASAGIQLSKDGLRSVALMDEGAWMGAATRAGAAKEVVQQYMDWARVHEAIPGTMITHALLNSGFGEAFDPGF